jgi:hypothetical protein
MREQTTLRRPVFRHADPVRPRSANEWRSFWHQGGDAALRAELRKVWRPLHGASDELCSRPAERVAILLGSNAPARALEAELGRIRADELHVKPDSEADHAAAHRISVWFRDQV